MSTFKKCKVVMLPTNQKTNGMICKDITGQDKIIAIKTKYLMEHEDYIGHHLYIISDDEIKEGDWFVRNNEIHQCYKIYNDEIEFKTSKNSVYCGTNTLWNKNYCKKIIATTDTSLGNYIWKQTNKKSKPYNVQQNIETTKKVFIPLPQPSQQFIQKYIEEYNKGQQITECLVEYEEY